jgi:putative PIN family toxin of toxin-antitoxin system
VKYKIVLDTNIIVRLLKRPDKTDLLKKLVTNYDIYTNNFILLETERILVGRFNCTVRRAKVFTGLYAKYCTVYGETKSKYANTIDLRDRSDRPIVDLCIQSKALYLLSNDKDLLVLGNIGSTIVKNSEYLDTLL